MPPVCSNCGASDFVWANDLKTGGSLSAGTLSLRPKGELSLGTRICKSCGHADLFLKDPSILRTPHTWRPGEFVPIPASGSGHHAHHGAPSAPAATPAPSPPTPVEPAPTPVVPNVDPPMLPPPPPPAVDVPPPPPPPGAEPGAAPAAKRSRRRKSKSSSEGG